jgi:hypothetical protein
MNFRINESLFWDESVVRTSARIMLLDIRQWLEETDALNSPAHTVKIGDKYSLLISPVCGVTPSIDTERKFPGTSLPD